VTARDPLKAARRALDKGDAARAVPHLESAADRGEPEALFLLGGLFLAGQGVAPSLAKAAALYKIAGDSGHGPALLALARIAPDASVRLDLLLKAAAAGLDDAMLEAGEMLAAGQGGGADLPRAHNLIRRAAEAGNPTAMTRLGMWLTAGMGARADPEEALAWLYAAVALGAGEEAHDAALRAADGLTGAELAAARARGKVLAKTTARH
jgi:TPR repeat protein